MDAVRDAEIIRTEGDRRRSRRRRWALFLCAVVVLPAGLFHRFLFLGNVGVVLHGHLLRSAQPHGRVGALVRDYGVRSILNLRGGSDQDDWYIEEVRETEERGVKLYDYPMSAVKRPRRSDLLTILDVFDVCNYPLLIHCKSGSDRTGMAVGLYLMSKRGVPPVEAEAAFSLEHGHVPLFGPERLHEPFIEYAEWLARVGAPHTPERLRWWITNEYRADDPPTETKPIRPGPRLRREVAADSSSPR